MRFDKDNPLPNGTRVYLDGGDVSDFCDAADTDEGWANCYTVRPNSRGAMARVEGTDQRRSGKVEFRARRT